MFNELRIIAIVFLSTLGGFTAFFLLVYIVSAITFHFVSKKKPEEKYLWRYDMDRKKLREKESSYRPSRIPEGAAYARENLLEKIVPPNEMNDAGAKTEIKKFDPQIVEIPGKFTSDLLNSPDTTSEQIVLEESAPDLPDVDRSYEKEDGEVPDAPINFDIPNYDQNESLIQSVDNQNEIKKM